MERSRGCPNAALARGGHFWWPEMVACFCSPVTLRAAASLESSCLKAYFASPLDLTDRENQASYPTDAIEGSYDAEKLCDCCMPSSTQRLNVVASLR